MKKIPMYWENDFKYNVCRVSQIIKGYKKKTCRYQSALLRFHNKKTCASDQRNDRNLSFI